MNEALKELVNLLSNPTILYLGSTAVFFLFMWKAEWFVQTKVFVAACLLMVLFFIWGMTDHHFATIVLKPDNIPIIIMLVLLIWLTWYAIRRGVDNDKREAEGKPLLEAEQSKRAMTWPNLVFIEFIALIGVTVFLIVWSVIFEAPLEEPANPNVTPNPSKAPWYFLGLQEMLVYFDPWLAGVVYPGLIVVGLMAIPYFDPNPKGNGYYTFKNRKFAIGIFLFGFLIQWVLLIILGTFMRGPGWNFFGPFEVWDPHKVEALTNVNLSEIIWVQILGQGLPSNILLRESFGFLVVFGYLLALPPLLAGQVMKRNWFAQKFAIFKGYYEQMGFVRYNVMCFLFLTFLSLPIKMVLRWSINLKYLVAIPEYFFNI